MNFTAVPLSAILIMCACALLAIALFAPRKPIVPPAVSFAPAAATATLAEPAYDLPGEFAPHPDPVPVPAPPFAPAEETFVKPSEPWSWATAVATVQSVQWPELVDPKAAGADRAARIGLVTALAAIRAPWADAILDAAAREEIDADVLSALEAARTLA